MKKTLALIVALLLVFSAGITAFAAPGSFMQSPSRNKAPILVEYTNASHDCFAQLFITAYGDRHNLDDASKLLMEEAYSSIAKTNDLGTLCADLNKIAADLGITSTDLLVSDLFDIDYNSCEDHNLHGKFTIKLTAETLSKYVALMQRVGDSWVIVDSAKLEGDYLTFESQDLTTYAIVVNGQGMILPDDGGEEGDFPETGGIASNVFFVTALVSLAGFAVVLVALKKKAK